MITLTAAFGLACLYGIVAAVLFNFSGTLRESTAARYVYSVGFIGMLILVGRTATQGGGASALVGIILCLFLGLVILLVNSVALYGTLEHFITRLGRGALGLDQMVMSKSYDRAVGAENRGDLDEAIRIYREEMAEDPEDTEAPRRLAEVLVKAGRPQDAVVELRALLELTQDKDEVCSIMFRLAEILDEALHDRPAAEELYGRIVREHPKRRLAEYARQRLGADT